MAFPNVESDQSQPWTRSSEKQVHPHASWGSPAVSGLTLQPVGPDPRCDPDSGAAARAGVHCVAFGRAFPQMPGSPLSCRILGSTSRTRPTWGWVAPACPPRPAEGVGAALPVPTRGLGAAAQTGFIGGASSEPPSRTQAL